MRLILAEVGRIREAVAEAQRAHEVEPLSTGCSAQMWSGSFILPAEYDEAELEFRKLMEWHPKFTVGYIMASVYLQTGRQREAVAELQQSAAKSHRSSIAVDVSGRTPWASRALEPRGIRYWRRCSLCRNEGTFRPSTSPSFMKAWASGTGHCSGSRRRTRNIQ